MLSIWIIHRDPQHRAALARIAGVGESAVLAGPTDRMLLGVGAPTVVVLGLSEDFELELDFVHRHGPRLEGCAWILLPSTSDLDEARRLFDTLPARFVTYPPNPRELRRCLRAAVARRHTHPLSKRQDRDELRQRFARWYSDLELPEMMRAIDPRLARVPILIHGEEGTGRGLLARYVHAFCGNGEDGFVQVACRPGARADDLLRQIQDGVLGAPGESVTVWLEDVDRLPQALQRRVRDWIEFGLPDGLLRGQRLRFIAGAGSTADLDADPGLDERLAEALSGLTLSIPPLRDRIEALDAFVSETAAAWADAHSEATRRFSDAAMSSLRGYPWPGNLHELEAVVTRTLSFTTANPVQDLHLRFPSDMQWLGDASLSAHSRNDDERSERPVDHPHASPAMHAPSAPSMDEVDLPLATLVEDDGVGHEDLPVHERVEPARHARTAPAPDRAEPDDLLDDLDFDDAIDQESDEFEMEDEGDEFDSLDELPMLEPEDDDGTPLIDADEDLEITSALASLTPGGDAGPEPSPLPAAPGGVPTAHSMAERAVSTAIPDHPVTAGPDTLTVGSGDDDSDSPQRRADAALRRLIGAVAHEVRNPLVSIRTFSELLPDHYDDAEFRSHFRELVGKDVDRIDRVVQRLQAMVDDGEHDVLPVDVARMLEGLIDERRTLIQSRRLLVLKELDHAEPHALGDETRIREALAGLLDRAMSTAAERGDVYISSKYSERGANGRPSMRVLIRHTHARPGGDGVQRGPSEAETALDLVLAESLIDAEGGRITIDQTDAQENVIVVDLPA